MSLKGNVAGMGLGELLQSLARGGRDGALTLYGEGLHAVLGFQDASIFLLPGEDETEDRWRTRAKDAWANEPNPQLEGNRRSSIAHAARLEVLYGMLDTENLHFSFWPGRLSQYQEARAAERAAKEGDERETAIGAPPVTQDDWGHGMAVEGVLLEHARLADEACGYTVPLSPHDVPRPYDDGEEKFDLRSFLGQCDGRSTVQEITDRLGWPVRQGFAEVQSLMAAGRLRLSSPRELLGSALSELELGYITRSASRFIGWIRSNDCGPLEAGDTEALIDEWERSRLPSVLQAMPGRDARAVVRRLDLVHQDRVAIIERWATLHQARRTDTRVTLRWLALRSAEASIEGKPPFPELIRLARHFQENDCWRRAAVALRIAASLAPTRMNQRIELGTRMVESGLTGEGGRWLLAAAQELIDLRQGEKALVPLRTLLEVDPNNRDAHALQVQARQRSSFNRKRRRNSVIGLAIVLAFSAAALVQVRSEQQQRRKLAAVTDMLNDPKAALAELERSFPDDTSDRVISLGQSLRQRIREDQRREQDAWIERFQGVQQECNEGDPMLGLRRTLDMPPPPEGSTAQANLPHRTEIFNTLVSRFRIRSSEVDAALDSTIQERHAEERYALMLEEIIEILDERELDKDPEAFTFFKQVSSMASEIRSRQERRANERAQRDQQQLEQQLDLLLAAARAHRDAGDIERAQSAYERFVELDDSGELVEFLAPEILAVKQHYEAYMAARERAWSGDHTEALALLEAIGANGQQVCPNPSEHMLPWRIKTEPEGARAVFADGLERVSPFTYESAFGERVKIAFQLDGCEPRTISVDGPQDLLVRMYQLPERTWETSSKVEALPLPVQNDHVVCDRQGVLARVDIDGKSVWKLKLSTLSGVARTPVFLPGKRGYLLVVSEEGKSWVIDAVTGEERNYWSAASPLVEGPFARSRGVSARFADGRIAEWVDDSEPTIKKSVLIFGEGGAPPPNLPPGQEKAGNLIALHHQANASSALASEWTEWVVEVYQDEYLVRKGGSSRGGFSVSRHGGWNFVAWEMPNPRLTFGRLWVSDEAGLRSYVPQH